MSSGRAELSHNDLGVSVGRSGMEKGREQRRPWLELPAAGVQPDVLGELTAQCLEERLRGRQCKAVMERRNPGEKGAQSKVV